MSRFGVILGWPLFRSWHSLNSAGFLYHSGGLAAGVPAGDVLVATPLVLDPAAL
jgi:hypothetical protein